MKLESSCSDILPAPSTHRSSSLLNETADTRLKTLTKTCFGKESRAAVWGLEETCECFKDIQFTQMLRHSSPLTSRPSCSLVGVWVADFHILYQFPGEERTETFRMQLIIQTKREVMRLVLSVWLFFFLPLGQRSSFTSHCLITYLLALN